MCRQFGLHVHDGVPAGGDALDDAIHDPDDEGGSASFVVQGSKWPQPGGLGSHITLTYSFQNLFDGVLKMPSGQPLPEDLIRHSIEEALGLWASAAPIDFVEVEDDGLDYGLGASQFGQLRFRHAPFDGPEPTTGGPKSKAYAYFPNSGFPIAGDVTFDHEDRWQEIGEFRQPDILGAAIHEIGHTLGLGHSLVELPGEFWIYQNPDGLGHLVDVMQPKGGANMYWIFTRYSGLGTGMLFADDIAGIQKVYGAGVGGVTPLVPEPASGVLVALALVTMVGRFCRRRPSCDRSSI